MGNDLQQLESAWGSIHEFSIVGSRAEADLVGLAISLNEFAQVSLEHNRGELQRGAQQLARLVEVAATWIRRYPDDATVVDEIMDFVMENLGELHAGIESIESIPAIDSMIELSNEAWSDYFIMTESSWGDELVSCDNELDDGLESDLDELSQGNQIELLLGALSGVTADSAETPENETRSVEEEGFDETFDPESLTENLQNSRPEAISPLKIDELPNPDSDRDAREQLQADREMLDAYLDDSLRCVATMESAALNLDANPANKESIRAFCRELHTLKGASGTVGLAGLASHLHQLETSLEETFAKDENVNTETLFEAIDYVRAEMDGLKPYERNPQTETLQQADPQPSKIANVPNARIVSPVASVSGAPQSGFVANDNSSIRVRAAQLDRLMDMLAELVVLRNRRESNASEFDLLYGELARCSTRLSISEEQSGRHTSTSVIDEVSKDIEAVARGFRALQKPVANDNAAISRFIRDFRHELMHLRRVPVSGLFGRLQRAARDAAKKEQKLVRVNVVGENVGLEQEIQERLYESLLHVVRNSVSHGIQSPEKRKAAGKDETGTITLEASGSAQLLVIEVRDDGNGVNYEAVRKRGVERGLIAPHHQATNAELANLIFHPGFSTKESVSEVSGRGVGMDVVATTLEQMRGKIEVESVSGKGTTIRLLIPRRTGIEHVMVFRCHDQLYALPMQSIVAAKKSREGFDQVSQFTFSRKQDQRSGNLLVIKRSGLAGESEETQIAVSVDELLGPEEVVVRALPPMLRNHPLFCGITLSGSGEKVLLLQSESVADYCLSESEFESQGIRAGVNENMLKALVVDDSITARKYVSKLLKENQFAVAEAGDGLEAIEMLHQSSFDLVVTDLDMPRLGGLELLADMRNGNYCSAPVLVVTSRDDDSFRVQAIERGAAGFINKPVSKQHFQRQLEKLGLTLATCQE